MWLAKKIAPAPEEQKIAAGKITVSSRGELAVEVDGELRGAELFAPGGTSWRPKPGQEVLVLKSDGVLAVCGAKTVPPEDGIQLTDGISSVTILPESIKITHDKAKIALDEDELLLEFGTYKMRMSSSGIWFSAKPSWPGL